MYSSTSRWMASLAYSNSSKPVNKKSWWRKFRFDPMRQLHTVHVRHPDVCHHNIRLKFFHHFQCFYTVVGRADNRKSQPLPVNFFIMICVTSSSSSTRRTVYLFASMASLSFICIQVLLLYHDSKKRARIIRLFFGCIFFIIFSERISDSPV